MNRRNFFEKVIPASLAVGAVASSCAPKAQRLYTDKHYYINKGYHQIPKLRLSMDRIVKETVGLRPFRASGPRLDVETLGSKTIVHNYGHGGSGWSLSWGTGNIARNNVLATKEKKIALLGCGAVGIATARLLQESGCEVTIYTKDVPPNITSNLATGTWSPASRVCDMKVAKPELQGIIEEAARFSFRRFQFLLGMDDIACWAEEYSVFNQAPVYIPGAGGEDFEIHGLVPERVRLSKKEHPFKADHVTRRANLMFNIPSYLRHHLNDFLIFGGKIKIQEIKKPEDIDALPEKVIVNCMGLGAKPVFNDQELTPVSGQLSCLIPQSEVNYKLYTQGASFISRKDGIYIGGNGIVGNWDTTPSKEQTEKTVGILQKLMQEMRG
ncbi:FAD-dependent oxidoreductase [Dyadobacter psychrotolerans]|uniref:D-amino-acid oxidase n=1 Tax=Dyadobacter psychrotolerans TaxID=2541721 RepID=A0A4R5E301_9BACT|nr:FAD-dependent oxidoreductase [Dyadobacter psychrotolerans]TDE18683.1 FAD-binding oxidoreductase [Dyadobacter psychrotolerans]